MPDPPTWQSLWAIRLDFLAYVLSFAFVAVIWVNHHHIFQLADQVEYPRRLGRRFLALLVNIGPSGHDLDWRPSL
ncbi:TMEM175 family protein [Schleiferilactobacillus harbinensis]|uniref:TMEM175 family protein n=1 Tax=Schleiferilactobacillus harbinensis TaxID=304207 RepID=UPI003AF808EA